MLDQPRSKRNTAVPVPSILNASAGFAPSCGFGKFFTTFLAVTSCTAAVFFDEYAISCSGLSASPT